MSQRPFITATLIAKDEADNVVRCLDSIWADVDEVVVADTGSSDDTIQALKRYADLRRQPGKLKIIHHQWTDDFSAARQAADDRASGEWLLWADFDDTVIGAASLREMARNASDDVIGFFCLYDYARDRAGNSISELWRERLVRNDATRWEGRLHEHKLFTHGQVVKVDPSAARWIHHRDHEQRTGERNLRILQKWDADEPNSPRIVASIAMEQMGMELHREASDTYARYLSLPGEAPDRRAQATRHMCVMLMRQGRISEARAAAYRTLEEMPNWPDTHLTLAEVEHTLGRPDLGILHAQTALRIGKPDSLLILNPVQYTAHPRALMAVALAQMGRYEEAVRSAEEALEAAPGFALAETYLPAWRGQLKKQRTLATWIASSDVLMEAGELIKARGVLGCAPFFIADEPGLIRQRVEVARLIRQRTENPPAGEVDEAADAFVRDQHQNLVP